MARKDNFLLGRGEVLVESVFVPSRGGPKKAPYDFPTARQRAIASVSSASGYFRALPSMACPGDEAVAVLTMHPRYTSKTDNPESLLRAVGLRAIGSRSKLVRPDAWGIKEPPEAAVTEQLFVAGERAAFDQWARNLRSWQESTPTAFHLTHIESFSALEAEAKMRQVPSEMDTAVFEIVLHTDSKNQIVREFLAYGRHVDKAVSVVRQRDVGHLAFLAVEAPASRLRDLALFSFVRVARGMPQIRPVRPIGVRSFFDQKVVLPTSPALDAATRAVVFDGGLPDEVDLSLWVSETASPDLAGSRDEHLDHGLAVTGALLFGPLSSTTNPPQPLCGIDHVRVLDINSGSKLEYVDVLSRILSHLDSNPDKYEFMCLCVGPDLPIQDDDVNQWTVELDRRFAHEKVLAVVAAGNTGLEHTSDLHRIQPPADGVNLLSVGASNAAVGDWSRVGYSSHGLGRSPGIVKPDGVAFGGSHEAPFLVVQRDLSLAGEMGTSFAAPLVLRCGIATRVQLGAELTPLAIRALLIHRAERDKLRHPLSEVGWGRFEHDLSRLITCEDHEVLTVFQGRLPLAGHIRAKVPMPGIALRGRVSIRATIVIAPQVDPAFASTYTLGGLEIFFRPNSQSKKPNDDGSIPANPTSIPFLTAKQMYGANFELKDGGEQWEPCRHAERSFLSKSLVEPCFDIEYQHRVGTAASSQIDPVPYALIVSMSAPRVRDLYNSVVRQYAQILTPLRPQVHIPVQGGPSSGKAPA